jgi:hypothetical protein
MRLGGQATAWHLGLTDKAGQRGGGGGSFTLRHSTVAMRLRWPTVTTMSRATQG